jgi:cation diffusion facilitator family transporter
MAEESRGAVLAAMAANLAIAVAKLVAGILTGSAAMLAEAGHSTADTVNQVFLLLGIRLSETSPDERHPHGYGKEAFFWSFLAAIFIFVAGAVFSVYEGVRTLVQESNHHRTHLELGIAYGVLGTAFLFESASYTVAVRTIRRSARQRGWSTRRYLRDSPNLTAKTVFFEDAAALSGLAIAALGLTLSELMHTEVWDGVASLGIGVLLAAVAFMLGVQSRRLLLGASANEETIVAIRQTVAEFHEVEGVVRLLTMQLGSHSVLVTGELRVRTELSITAVEGVISRLDSRLLQTAPEVKETFWELR